jgi:hypothetical protein
MASLGESDMSSIRTTQPTECILWKTEKLSIEQVRGCFQLVTVYEDDSHLTRKALRCKECGHLYFYEFYEEIDWSEGKDAQFITWIPIDDLESGEELRKLSPYEILNFLSIRYDCPMGADQPTGPDWNCRRNTLN